jgi:mRNA-degrading endonuclease RelE of RelBE toxin-antitoxin system
VAFTVTLKDEARARLRGLAPVPKREVRRTLREMEDDPFALNTIPLRPPSHGLYRVRVGDYRIVFWPGPGRSEVTVTRIGHRESVYEGLERVSGE